MRPLVGLVLLTLALGGCATYAWTKPGVAADTAAQDLAECQRQGRVAASEIVRWAWQSGGFWWGNPWVGDPWRWPTSSAFFSPGLPPPGWQFDIERRITDRRMADKGYELVKQPRAADGV